MLFQVIDFSDVNQVGYDFRYSTIWQLRNCMKKSSIKLNIIMNMMLTLSSFIFPLITFPYVSRVLLPDGTGKVSFATSVISYFLMFSQLGIPTYGIRICAQVRDDRKELTRVSHELLCINIFMSILSYIVLFFVLYQVPRFQVDQNLFIIISSTIFLSAIGVEWLYKGLELYTYITVRSVIFKLVALIATFLFIHQKSDYVIYGTISIFASSASYILNIINARKYIDFKPIGEYNFRRHLKPILTFFAMSCATTVYTNLDTVMLGFMTSDAEVGCYSAAIKIKNILVAIVTSIGAVLLPTASYYVEKGLMNDFHRIANKAITLVLHIATPLMLYFIFFAKEGVNFLSGPAFAKAILPMQVVMPTVVFIGITNIIGFQILVPLGKEKTVLLSEIVGAILDLMINALLIPQYGSIGAAIGTTVAEFSVLTVQVFSIRSEIKNIICNVHWNKILLANAVGMLFSIPARNLDSNDFVILVISAVLFFIGYIMVMIITKDVFILEIIDSIRCRNWNRSEK